MAIHLIIAGHGRRKNGTFDPGASGFIGKGEHRYVKENLFPAMKKYAGKDFIFHDSYNVFSYGDIVSLARKYKATSVTEVHFDASGSPQASGGHVIVYSHYKPDNMDLRLRDAIKSMVGVRYSHAGHQGISGRNNLANVNRTASGKVNYRMLELGFGTNKRDADIMVNKVDEYAKKLVEAIKGAKVDKVSTPLPPSKPSPAPSKPKPSTSKWTKVSGNWSGQTLRRGQHGEPVRQMQSLLASKYYYPNKGAKNNGVDGYFGADTLDATRRYQSMHGLTVDGLPGKSTYASLKGTKAQPKPKSAWSGQVLRSGNRGSAVRQLQEMLSAKHYYPNKGAKNNGIDGIYGAKTKNAVERYQLINGLSVDGIAGRATYNSLNK